MDMLTALAGGVGAARFLEGLAGVVPQEEITAIVNTGDDIELYGLHVSPDLDIVTYTLAGQVDEERGWGIRGDTFHCLEALAGLSYETWFRIGDRDLATHIHRTMLLKNGLTLSEATKKVRGAFGVGVNILPMTDHKVETKIRTDKDVVHFQEFLVKRGAADRVQGVIFEGVEEAEPAPGVLPSLMEAEAVIVCPSNPIVSIGTILAVHGVRDALRKTKARVVAISPIIGGAPVKGPADKLMGGLGIEVSATGVAGLYKDFVDVFIIDNVDVSERPRIEAMGMRVIVTNTLMRNISDKVQLARTVLDACRN